MEENNTYRDTISTVDTKGKRVWVFPKKPAGWWYNKRKLLSYFLLAFLFAGPFLRIGGQPLLMLNLLERHFVILGQTFHPQDFHLFALAMITFVVFIILFTVVFGRLFCGWVCPQTIFMEMVFRRIEYLIEGDWKDQMRLKKLPWNKEKILKKGLKNLIFWLISFFIANTFLAYIIGSEALLDIVTSPVSEHFGGFVAIAIFTSVFFAVFSLAREQVCTFVCPYGRLQSVLLDRNSLVVAYDNVRGETRGKIRKGEDRQEAKKGDCIDCNLCVNVCPTGIDIRNGTQLECINCTACIDACDHMMESVGMEKGLVRFASTETIEKGSKFVLSTRAKAYSVVLVGLMVLIGALLITRTDIEATVLRTRGTLFTKMDEATYSNIYDIAVVNKTNTDAPIRIEVLEGNAEVQMIGDKLNVEARGEHTGKFMILMKKDQMKRGKNELKLGIYNNDKLEETISTTFIGPI
ncbi:MAG: cytochrome c oxidase accessory protein CcoG [Flavobacteriaceae bacterium]|nr:cytochrome c oxidase accessory protein CcoG [Flavobacteriaceae bacterium]